MAEGGPGGDGKSTNIGVANFTPRDGVISVGAKDVATGAPVQAEALSSDDSERFRTLSGAKDQKSDGNPKNQKVADNKDTAKGADHGPEVDRSSKESFGRKQKEVSDAKSKNTDKKDSGNSPEEDFGSMDFSELNSLRKNFATESGRRTNAEKEFYRRVEKFKSLRDGGVVNDLRHHYLTLVRATDWDGLYVAISDKADELEDKFEKGAGKQHPELRGVITEVLNVERAQLLLEGMRKEGISGMDVDWLRKHGFTQKDYNKFQELVLPVNSVLDVERMGIKELAKMVGKDTVKPAEPQAVIDYEKMQTAVKGGTEEALNKPTTEAAKRSVLIDEENMQVFSQPITEATPFLVGADLKEIKEWQTRALLSAACNRKLNSKNIEALSQNPEAQAITLEQLHLLLSKPGVLQLLSMEAVLIARDLNPNQILANIPGLPESVFKIYNENQLAAFRAAKIAWLGNTLGIFGEDAEIAASISRNLIFLSDTLEDYDSAFDQNGNLVNPNHDYAAAALGKIKSMAVWQAMHLTERLALKAKGGEIWSVLGNWALRKFRGVSDPTKKQQVAIDIINQEPLPSSLFKSAFEIKEANGWKIIDLLIANGENLVRGVDNVYMPDLHGENMKEGPFAYYAINNLSAAKDILDIITDDSRSIERDKKWGKFINAANNLGMNNVDREKILKAIYGVKTNSRKVQVNNLGYVFYRWGAGYGNKNFWLKEGVVDRIRQGKLYKTIQGLFG